MKELILTLLTVGSVSGFLTSSVFAQSSEGVELMKEIQQSNPDASKHEILKLFYENSMEPADIDRFPRVGGEASSFQCREPQLQRIKDKLEINENKLKKTFILAKQKNNRGFFQRREGEVRLFSSDYAAHDPVLSSRNLESAIKAVYSMTSMDETAYDTIVSLNQSTTYNQDAPYKIYLRQHGELISFKYVEFKKNSDGPLFGDETKRVRYGYCWE